MWSRTEREPGRRADEDWYATNPGVLEDAGARAKLLHSLGEGQVENARRTVLEIEREVARDPAAAFSFADDGVASLVAAGRTFGAGRFALPTIGELRARCANRPGRRSGRIRFSILRGTHGLTDVGALQATAPPGTLIQVASQFDCLESTAAHIAPVATYLSDNTQGPRASISAFPGTLLRHYLAPAADGSRFRQGDGRCLDLLGEVLDPHVAQVRNGYLMGGAIVDVRAAARALRDGFEQIRVGVHDDVEVAFGWRWGGRVPRAGQRIAQTFSSTVALGGYAPGVRPGDVLDVIRPLQRAAYVGTLLAAAALAKRTVVLTLVGGGVFENPHAEIWGAIRDAVAEVEPLVDGDLHVVVNAREAIDDAAAAEARARGGFVTEIR